MLRRVAIVAVPALLAGGELVHWWASKRYLGAVKGGVGDGSGGRGAVVVLGFGNRGVRANYINRYRVRAGIRTLESCDRRSKSPCGFAARARSAAGWNSAARRDSAAGKGRENRLASSVGSVLVLCGGPVAGAVPEADLLERYARKLGYAGPILLDRESRSTLQNIEHAIPLIEHADSIAIVSNPLHALKGRILLWKMRPDLAARLVRGSDYRFGEMSLLKPIAAAAGIVHFRAFPRRPMCTLA